MRLQQGSWDNQRGMQPVESILPTCVQAQQEACAALSELGLSHAAAVITNGGLLKPDVVVMTPTARVALTLDQASSFSTNAPHRPLGDAILTWRLLVLHDWQVGLSHIFAPVHCPRLSACCVSDFVFA